MFDKEIRLHSFGASGSGVSTLGGALSAELDIPVFDFDNYYWERSDPPFTVKRGYDERYRLLLKDIDNSKSYIISGHYGTIVELLDKMLTHAIFIYASSNLRIVWLKSREFKDYGVRILPYADMHDSYNEFIEWAKGYDASNLEGRNLKQHEERIAELNCPVLKLNGDEELERKLKIVMDFYSIHNHLLANNVL